MSEPIETRIAASRASRAHARRRRKALTLFSLVALAASIVTDEVVDAPIDGGTHPVVIVLVGCLQFGLLWSAARRHEGVERLIVGRAAMIAVGVVSIFAARSYVVWLLADTDTGPGRYLMIIGVGLWSGSILGGIGLTTQSEGK